jgi:hypothetical protein
VERDQGRVLWLQVRRAAELERAGREGLEVAPLVVVGHLLDDAEGQREVDRLAAFGGGEGAEGEGEERWLLGLGGLWRRRCGGVEEAAEERVDLRVRPGAGDEVAAGVLDEGGDRGVEGVVQRARAVGGDEDVEAAVHVEGGHADAARLDVRGVGGGPRRERGDARGELEVEHGVRLHRGEQGGHRAALGEPEDAVERAVGADELLEVGDRGVDALVLVVVDGRQPPHAVLGVLGDLAERGEGRGAGVTLRAVDQRAGDVHEVSDVGEGEPQLAGAGAEHVAVLPEAVEREDLEARAGRLLGWLGPRRGFGRRVGLGARLLRAHEQGGELGAPQEGLLVGGAGAAEGGVAVRVAAEPLEHVDVLLGADAPAAGGALLGAGAAGAELGDAGEGAAHVGDLLAVAEREEHEQGLARGELAVEAAGERVLGDGPGERVVGERAGGRAVDVPRELIEEEDQREVRAEVVAPVIELAAGGAVDEAAEVGRDLGVDVGAGAKPQVLGRGVALGERVGERLGGARQVAPGEPVIPDARGVMVDE